MSAELEFLRQQSRKPAKRASVPRAARLRNEADRRALRLAAEVITRRHTLTPEANVDVFAARAYLLELANAIR